MVPGTPKNECGAAHTVPSAPDTNLKRPSTVHDMTPHTGLYARAHILLDTPHFSRLAGPVFEHLFDNGGVTYA